MDLLSLLHNNFSPAKKLESAILQNNVGLLEEVLQTGGVNVDVKVQAQGGNTALHLAAREGYVKCVDKLLEYNADPDKNNDFNLSSVAMAFRMKRYRCLELLLEKSRYWLSFDSFWLNDYVASFLWTATNELNDLCFLLSVLIKATPDFSRTRTNLKQNLFFKCRDTSLTHVLKIWRMTEDLDSESFITRQKSSFNQSIEEHKQFVEWLDEYNKTPKSLAHFSRLAVRKSFHQHCNVYYGASQLIIPTSLKHDVTMEFEC